MQTKQVAPIAQRENIKTNRAKMVAKIVIPDIIIRVILLSVKLLVKIVRLENQTQWQGQIATYAPPGNINPRQLN